MKKVKLKLLSWISKLIWKLDYKINKCKFQPGIFGCDVNVSRPESNKLYIVQSIENPENKFGIMSGGKAGIFKY